MTTPPDDNSVNDRINQLGFDGLVRLKAQRKEEMANLRASWRARTEAMSPADREAEGERFDRAFSKIASQFGRSRRLALPDDERQKDPD